MTLPIERSRSRRPVTWLTIIGVVLLPVVIGGILIGSLYNPTERLDNLSAAIVNNDDPVTIDGQTVPLGRQLTAGLVDGSDELESNLTWTISNTEDAEEGLADGTYNAIITIPENFSAAATSTMPDSTPEQATIQVTTPPDSLIVDDAITSQVATTAASLLGEQLSAGYLENVLMGFTTLGDKLGDAADGAGQLADGADQAAEGTISLADGIAQLSGGVGQLAGGASELAAGADGIASGAAPLASGAHQLADGTAATAAGLDKWATGARGIADGQAGLADGLDQIAAGVSGLPDVPPELADAADELAANSEAITGTVTDAADQLAALSADCVAEGGSAELCDAVAQVSARVNDALPTVTGILANSDQIADGVRQLTAFEPTLVAALQQSADGAHSLAAGSDKLADGAAKSADGLGTIAGGLSAVASGVGQLGDGAATWSAGARTWATGAQTLATKTAEAATGADTLADGVGEIADGTGELATGLDTAVDGIPSYTDAEAADLAGVVANPVVAEGAGTELFGASAVPLLATIALWFGALATFIALQAVSRRTLVSRQPSALLALRALAPAAGLGALQGLLVAGVVQLAASYTWAEWSVFAGVAVVAGVAFATINQALLAVFGGAGRWVSALIGVLAVATGVVSTVPGLLSGIAALMPTAPAYNAMVGALTAASGVGAGLAGLVIWSVLGFITTVIVVSRRRTTSVRALMAASPVTA
ncbi:YhgE/Pip domain-containing protein [Microbacterium terricola]|uniref:ABC-2 type transporter transmembrane domain-containing protein n=1 Tax=Microbacterium terricola TaxID=344163 RepID=A0ABM8E153_9MICO|nr:YhgE/Pip domain-containing protein [Microbacterium terricola]UYK40594.1 YhgE/Pip domain-containing protein [Microbacterium terricola]BDV31677.1 hypothetical protein Microterr_23370 [Microbacterium terricola]